MCIKEFLPFDGKHHARYSGGGYAFLLFNCSKARLARFWEK